MPKRILTDMVNPRNKKREVIKKELKPNPVREIQEVRFPSARREFSKYERDIPIVAKDPKIKNKSRYMLWFVAVISIIFCFFAISFLFSKAEVSVNPKIKEKKLNENLSAVKDSDKDALSFNLLKISGEEEKAVESTGEKDVFVKAEGVVKIFNTFSTTPQTFVAGIKLEGSNGKIYKTQTKIIVGGKSKSGDAGSAEVKISGAEAGEEYNSAPLDFKILSFKGTAKYAKFNGRSKGPITGGFKGKTPFISDADKTLATNDLKNILKDKLLKKATSQIPSGFILFKDAVFLNLDDTSVPYAKTGENLKITIKGTLYGVLFNEEKLTQKIVGNNIEKYDGSKVFIPHIRDLIFTLSNKDNASLEDLKNIDFNLSGSAKIVWEVDQDKFVKSLLGKSKNDFNIILSQYPNIDSATLVLSPVWKLSVPEKKEDIKLIINYPL